MRQNQLSLLRLALFLGATCSLAWAAPGHDDGEGAAFQRRDGGGHGGHGHGMSMNVTVDWSESFDVPNYFRHPSHGGWMYAHIAAMVVAWFILLPLSVMFSIARSRYTLLTQLAFNGVNALGLAVGTIYNANTPDLYAGNAHHTLGWVLTWFSFAWTAVGVINTYGFDSRSSSTQNGYFARPTYQQIRQSEQQQASPQRRWSGDSGHGTDHRSSLCPSSASPASESSQTDFHPAHVADADDFDHADEDGDAEKRSGFLSGTRVDRLLARHAPRFLMGKTAWVLRTVYVVFERSLILLGFAALCSGFVTWGGIFRGSQVFGGVAHFIKGGIFLWIGILSIGRWAGAFANLGWAWNVAPPTSSSKTSPPPSFELVESALICFYGVSNVWLEHLTAWGQVWSPMDYEHVSITVLFFGGGLLGMLVESRRVRALLNASLSQGHEADDHFANDDHHHHHQHHGTDATPSPPTPLNPLPALTILLLGIIMASHTQHSGLASTLHQLWGQLFASAALARTGTYALHYVRPPTSSVPARPPTELLVGFALVAGGALFMLSARDVTDALAGAGADAMVPFVVCAGVTAVVCAGTVGALAAKGWAVRRERRGTGQGGARMGSGVGV